MPRSSTRRLEPGAAPNIFFIAHPGQADEGPGSGFEDHLTEALRFYFSVDVEALRRYCQFVLDDPTAQPLRVSSQWSGDNNKRPDLRVDLSDGRMLLVEHKIEQALSVDKKTGQNQLEYYLALDKPERPVFVALFSKRTQRIPNSLLEQHSNYLHPLDRDFYDWHDLYENIPSAGKESLGLHYLRSYFRSYLRWLGFEPSKLDGNSEKLFLVNSKDPANEEVQDEFGRRLRPLRKTVRALGYSTSSVSHFGFNAKPKNKQPFLHFSVHPWKAPTRSLSPLVSENLGQHALGLLFTFDHKKPNDKDFEIHRRFGEGTERPFKDPTGGLWYSVTPHRMSGGSRTRLAFITAINPFLADGVDLAARLEEACAAVLEYSLKIIEEVY